jgi:uncharacterized HhH-GPD family protein
VAGTTRTFPVTGDPEADRLLVEDPLALLIGMLLDQQVPMEWAFKSPSVLRERLGGELNAVEIAAMDPDDLDRIFREKPSLHRYPGSMAKRVHELCRHVVERYLGDPTSIWTTAATGAELYDRLRMLPGFGEEKSKIFTAVLAKRLGIAPPGWEECAGVFADSTPRSVADVDSAESLARVREFKQAMKAQKRDKQGRPAG